MYIALLDDDPIIRGQAVYAVGRRCGMEASIVIDQALIDEVPSVKLMAIDALAASDGESMPCSGRLWRMKMQQLESWHRSKGWWLGKTKKIVVDGTSLIQVNDVFIVAIYRRGL